MIRSVLPAFALFASLLCAAQARSAEALSDDALSGAVSAPRAPPADIVTTSPVLDPSVLCEAGAEPKGEAGMVRLRFHVTNEGKVDEVILLDSSGKPEFDEIAIAHAKTRWRFTAATANGRPVPAWINGRLAYDSGADCTIPPRAPPAADAEPAGN